MLRYLQLLLKVANHVALLMPEVKQTEDQQRRVGAVPAEDWVRINNRKRVLGLFRERGSHSARNPETGLFPFVHRCLDLRNL